MAGYFPLGARPVTAALDQTGQNPGNWTAVFDPHQIQITAPVFELYHLYLTAPTLPGKSTTAKVIIDLMPWDITLIGQGNSWDPSQPALMTPGNTLYILFNVPVSTGPAPTVVAWFRQQT